MCTTFLLDRRAAPAASAAGLTNPTSIVPVPLRVVYLWEYRRSNSCTDSSPLPSRCQTSKQRVWLTLPQRAAKPPTTSTFKGQPRMTRDPSDTRFSWRILVHHQQRCGRAAQEASAEVPPWPEPASHASHACHPKSDCRPRASLLLCNSPGVLLN